MHIVKQNMTDFFELCIWSILWRQGFFFGGGGEGRGGIETKTAQRCQIQVNVSPYRKFQSPNFSLREGSKKKFDTASSRGLP